MYTENDQTNNYPVVCQIILIKIYSISYHSPIKDRPIIMLYHFDIDISNIQRFRRGCCLFGPSYLKMYINC